jgi:NhaP-type Na+/H+ or K+/H+ antiporter
LFRGIAVIVFVVGLILGVRVMFFGVQKRQGTEYLYSRVWPFALSIFFLLSGAALYWRAGRAPAVGLGWPVGIGVTALVVAASVWWLVRKSAIAPSTDPEDDPRYRFQGHIARIVSAIGAGPSSPTGRVAFEFDGQSHEFRARWTPEAEASGALAAMNDDVVIERVEDDVAFVEPWSIVEQRL